MKRILLVIVSLLLAAAPSFAATASFGFASQWYGGGNGTFTITNNTTQPINGWTLEFDWGATIGDLWNGTITSHVGNHFVVTNASWNGTIAAGASITVGCSASFTPAGLQPTNLSINGSASGGGGGGGTGGGGSGTLPAITSATTATAFVDSAFAYQITASGTPTSFDATGLPSGLGVNTATGLISGTPITAATTSVVIKATNVAGSATATLTLSVSNCAGDGNGDGTVDSGDMAELLLSFGEPSAYDLDGSGITDNGDTALLLLNYGACPVVNNTDSYARMPTVEQRKIVGYYPNWGIYQKNFPVGSLRADRINVVNYAFLVPVDRTMPASWDRIVSSYRGWKYANYATYLQQPSGTQCTAGVALFDEWADARADTAASALTMSPASNAGSNFAQLRDLKATHSKLRTMISIGGWTLSTPFFSIARDATKRADFAKSAVYVMVRYGFDGIDLDWEYPGGGGLEQSGIGDAATDSANYVLLLKALRAEMNRQSAIDGHTYYLSIAAPAGDGNIANLNPKAISDVVDWINLMSYDFHGGWDSTTGFNSPMANVDPNPSSAKWSVSASVQGYLVGNPGQGGVPASKLVVGVPFYGRGWDNVQPGASGNGLGQAGTAATSPGLGESEFPYNNLLSSGVLTYSNGVFAGGAGYTRHWNAQAQVPFLYSPTAKRFITYDDAESMRVKAAYVNQQSLGGMMFWEASEDVTTPGVSLMDAVYEGMRLP